MHRIPPPRFRRSRSATEIGIDFLFGGRGAETMLSQPGERIVLRDAHWPPMVRFLLTTNPSHVDTPFPVPGLRMGTNSAAYAAQQQRLRLAPLVADFSM